MPNFRYDAFTENDPINRITGKDLGKVPLKETFWVS